MLYVFVVGIYFCVVGCCCDWCGVVLDVVIVVDVGVFCGGCFYWVEGDWVGIWYGVDVLFGGIWGGFFDVFDWVGV